MVELPFHPPRKSKNIDKESFDVMMEAGSVTRATELLALRGYRNSRTGKPYTRMAVYIASIRYMVYHHEEVKDGLFELWRVQNRIDDVTDEEWEEYIVEKAAIYLGNNSKGCFMRWLAENPWAENYDYIYAKRFGIARKSQSEI
jgi:hypothetical protein